MLGVRTEWVGYGRPAAGTLRAAIARAKGDDPLSPVTVVVPSNHVGVAARRLLASGALGPLSSQGRGVAAITFLTVYRLGELLGSARLAGEGRRPVSTPVIAAALRAALAADPGVFAPVATHPATEMALVASYRELRDVSSDALTALSRQSKRAANVVRLHRVAHERLRGAWYDEEDLMDAAATVVGDDGPGTRDLGAVIIYLPQRLSRHGATLLRTVAEKRDTVIIAGTTGDTAADAEVVRSVEWLGGETPRGDAGIPQPMSVVDEKRTRLATASDADEEVREAVRTVIGAARDGTPLDRIAVLFASPAPYARLAYEQLDAAGLRQNGTSVLPLSARMAGRTLLGLLALPETGFRREEVFSLLAGSPLRHQRRPIPVGSWERISRAAGVVAGRDQWDRRLARFAVDTREKAEKLTADPDVDDQRLDHLRGQAATAEALREFVLGLIDDLAAAAATPRRWEEHARWAGRHLSDLLGGPSARDLWPTREQQAAERVERALERMAALGQVEGPVSLDVFARTFELELDADLGRVGRMGDGVFVGPVSMAVGLDLDLVVILGMVEGSFPAPVRDDSLLPDSERRAAGDELGRRADLVERRHRELLAALAGASRHLLCIPRGNLRQSEERVPSRWALDVASALAGKRWWSEDLLDARRDWLLHVPSFEAGLRGTTVPATDQEFRVRALMGGAESLVDAATELGDNVLAAGATVVAERRSDGFTRFDGNLDGIDLPSPTEGVTSATRLEGWADCPFAYLLRSVLGVEEVENPEEELAITALDRGLLVHEVLEKFINEILEPPTDQPVPGKAWTSSDLSRLLEIAGEVCDDFEARGLTGRPVFWQHDKRRILNELAQVLELDSEQRVIAGTRPLAAELAFGLDRAALGPVDLGLADGRRVAFRGKADRLDVAKDGTLYVVDYKTGRHDGYRDLNEHNPDQGGRRLQLAVYGQAARAHVGDPNARVRATYWFVSDKGRYKRIGYEVTPEVLKLVGESLGQVVAGIEAGVFCHHPTASSTSPWVECAYCDPDGLGVGDLRGAWTRKSSDPQMSLFVSLAEPDDDEAPDAELDNGESSD